MNVNKVITAMLFIIFSSSLYGQLKVQKGLSITSPLRIDSFYVQYESQHTSLVDSITFLKNSVSFQTARAQFNASVLKIPLTVRYQYQQLSGWAFPAIISNPVIEFNRNMFVKSMEERIRASFDVNSLVGERLAAIQSLKDLALRELKTELLSGVSKDNKEAFAKVNQLNDWREIMNGDINYFNNKIIGEKELAGIRSDELVIAATQEKINNKQAVDSAAYNGSVTHLQKVKDMQALVQGIMKYKRKWDESGLVRMIKKMELEKDMQLKEMLSNPAILAKMARNKLPLQKIEKIFLSIKQLQTGGGANNLSPLTLEQSLRSSGFNLEAIGKGKGSVFATMGKMQELYSVAERSLAQGSQVNSAGSMAGISFGNQSSNGNGQEQSSKFSLFSFATSSSGAGTNLISPLSGSVARNFVFTISKKISIGSKGSLVTEISKSAAQQQNEDKATTGNIGNVSATSRMLGTDNFFSNLGLNVEYSNEFPGIDLSHDLSFRYAGKGYSNQGNSYLISGSKEVYNSLQKGFFNQKLKIIIKNRYKTYSLDDYGKRVDNISNTIDIRWRFNKGNYIAVKYQPSYTASTNGGITQNSVNTTRLAADLNIRNKFSKVQLQNFIDLAYLSTSTVFAGSNNEVYKTLQLTTTHSVMKGSQQYFVNTNFNYAFSNGSLPFLNSSFLLESGIVYDVLKNIKFTSALNYNMVQRWYSQMVFKQGIGGRIGNKIDLGFSVDIAKNFKVTQPYPVQTFRSDISLRYLIF